eukprot:ctg_497.g157
MFVTPVGLAPSRCRGERRQVGGPLRRFSVRRGGGCARLAWAMRHRERSQPTDEEAVDGGPGWELEETLGERQQNVAEDDELLRTLEGDLASRSAAGGGSVGEVDAAYVGLFERAAQLTARLRAEQDSAGGAGSPRPLFVPASMNVTPFVMDADGDGRKAAANLLARVRRVSGDVDVELPSYEEPPLSMPTRRPAVMSVAGDNGRSEPPPPGTPGRPSAAGDVDSVMPPPATTSRRSHREANASRVSLLELTILAQQRQLDEPLPPLPRPSMSAEAAAELYAEFRAALYAGMRGSKATPQSGSWPLTKTAASATRYLLRALELVRSNNISAYLTTVELSDLMLGFCRLRLLPRVMEAFKLVTALASGGGGDVLFRQVRGPRGAEAAARRPGQRACLPPTVVMYNTLIAGFARSQRLDMALAYYARLKASPWRLRPDRFTFSTLLDACARACDIERALQLFEEMQALGVHADEVVYATVMDAAARAGRRRLAMALAGLMVRRGLPPNDIIMAMLIGSCAADGLATDRPRLHQPDRGVLSERPAASGDGHAEHDAPRRPAAERHHVCRAGERLGGVRSAGSRVWGGAGDASRPLRTEHADAERAAGGMPPLRQPTGGPLGVRGHAARVARTARAPGRCHGGDGQQRSGHVAGDVARAQRRHLRDDDPAGKRPGTAPPGGDALPARCHRAGPAELAHLPHDARGVHSRAVRGVAAGAVGGRRGEDEGGLGCRGATGVAAGVANNRSGSGAGGVRTGGEREGVVSVKGDGCSGVRHRWRRKGCARHFGRRSRHREERVVVRSGSVHRERAVGAVGKAAALDTLLLLLLLLSSSSSSLSSSGAAEPARGLLGNQVFREARRRVCRLTELGRVESPSTGRGLVQVEPIQRGDAAVLARSRAFLPAVLESVCRVPAAGAEGTGAGQGDVARGLRHGESGMGGRQSEEPDDVAE